jgi:hypothetical protein
MIKKGVFMVYQKSGYIGTGDKVPITNEKQEPLLPSEVEKAIREKKEADKKDPPDPKKKQAPLLPPNVKTDNK